MNIKKIIFYSLVLFSIPLLHADSTADLFIAIEQGNVQAVKEALALGANIDFRREDGHSPRSLATVKLNEALGTPSSPSNLAAIASLTLPVAAFMHSPKNALLSLLSIAVGSTLAASHSDGTIASLKKMHAPELLSHAGMLGFLITAWSSDQTLNKMLSSVGTIGTLVLYYKHFMVNNWIKIDDAVNKSPATKTLLSLLK